MSFAIAQDGRGRAATVAVGLLGVPIAGLLSASACYPFRESLLLPGTSGQMAVEACSLVGVCLAAAAASVAALALPVRQWLRVAAAVCFAVFGVAVHFAVGDVVTGWLRVLFADG